METAGMRPEPKATQVPDLEEAGRSPPGASQDGSLQDLGFKAFRAGKFHSCCFKTAGCGHLKQPSTASSAQEGTWGVLHVDLGCFQQALHVAVAFCLHSLNMVRRHLWSLPSEHAIHPS